MKICTDCKGEGQKLELISVSEGPFGPIYNEEYIECETCNGTGEIEEEK